MRSRNDLRCSGRADTACGGASARFVTTLLHVREWSGLRSRPGAQAGLARSSGSDPYLQASGASAAEASTPWQSCSLVTQPASRTRFRVSLVTGVGLRMNDLTV